MTAAQGDAGSAAEARPGAGEEKMMKKILFIFEVGSGLEGIIPDGLAGTIGRAVLIPAFREGKYIDGIEKAVDGIGTIMQAVRRSCVSRDSPVSGCTAGQPRRRDGCRPG